MQTLQRMHRSSMSSGLQRPVRLTQAQHPAQLTSRPQVLARGRTFRENDDGSVVEVTEAARPAAPATPGQQGTVYADQVQQEMQAMRKKSNLSKEMKARLRQEYVGLGGAENKWLPNPRRPAVVAALSVEERVVVEVTAAPSSQPPLQPVRSSKWQIDPSENLKSTAEHRFWTFLSMGLMGATVAQGLSGVHSLTEGVEATLALAAAYVLSDLGTGIYHWSVDNYGDGTTPLVGKQIAAFQGHHQRPWTITEREFCNNVHQVFKPAVAPAALFLVLSHWNSPAFNTFMGSFIFLVCMSQQFHAWSHMKKSELPAVVVALQDAGVLVSRKMHGAHHKPPFNANYCIVSGLWNPLLDGSGFFVAFEKAVQSVTGVEPRSWHEHPEWQEQERPTTSNGV